MDRFDAEGWPEEDGRMTTDEFPALDVRQLKRAGIIHSEQEVVEGIAHLAWTPCNFGGSRPWFVCPGEGCGRRVAILHGPEVGQVLCRHCRNLKEIFEAKGCEIVYLPPYSPDFNPIEQAFSKVKGLLRKAEARTREALIEAMGWALDAVSAGEAQGFFGHCGYHSMDQLL